MIRQDGTGNFAMLNSQIVITEDAVRLLTAAELAGLPDGVSQAVRVTNGCQALLVAWDRELSDDEVAQASASLSKQVA